MSKKKKIQKILLSISVILVFTILYFLFFDSKTIRNDPNADHDSSYLVKPYFRGIGKDKNLYEINASKAIETVDDNYDLYDVFMKYYMDKDKGSYFSANSLSGVMDKRNDILNFVESVEMIYSEGYRGVSDNLTVDLSKRTIYTKSPFNMSGIKGKIFSDNGFFFEIQTKKILFYGPVKTLLFDQKL